MRGELPKSSTKLNEMFIYNYDGRFQQMRTQTETHGDDYKLDNNNKCQAIGAIEKHHGDTQPVWNPSRPVGEEDRRVGCLRFWPI